MPTNLEEHCCLCGDVLLDDTANTSPDGEPMCADCFNDTYFTCVVCSNVCHRDEMRCTEWDTEEYCEACFNDAFYTCDECGGLCHRDNGHYCDCDRFMCDNCQCYDCECSGLHEYDYKPEPIFHGCGPYYGMEIETDNYNSMSKQDACNELLAASNNQRSFYLKADGSLERGVEIVTHPRGADSWVGFQENLEDVTRIVQSNGGKSFNTSTCGIHIHRGVRDLTLVDKAKMIWFFTACRTQIVTLAQRKSSYASFDMGQEGCGGVKYVFKAVKGRRHACDRRQALNFCNDSSSYDNDGTVEFRIFKGTLKVSTIYGYLGFAHYVTGFCKSSLVSSMVNKSAQILWREFVKYVESRVLKGETLARYLLDYLIKRGLHHVSSSI